MSEYVEKCPCCNNHSLEVTQHDWGEERRCELCGFAVAPSLPTQAHVGNAVAFVSAACSWFDEKNLDMPLDEHLAEAIRSGVGTLVFAGERKVSSEEAEKLAEEFQAEVIDKFYVREEEDDSQESRVQVEEPGERLTIRLPQEAWNTLWESLEIDARSTAVAPELRRELREALDQVEYVSDAPSLAQAAQDVLEWAAQMGGWEAPCWERLRRAVREAATQGESPDSAEAALRHIYDLLYRDIGPTGDFYNPDKVWDADTLDAIARVARERFKGPDCPADQAGEETADDAG